MEAVVQTHDLTKRFRGGRIAVDGLSVSVPRGAVTGLCGPNGAGKTTTLRLLLGLLRPTGGRVDLFGKDVRGRGRLDVLRRTGAVVEGPAFYPYLSGADNLRVLADATGGVAASRIEEALEEVGLKGRGGDRAAAYSHGMKQRLAIAGALLAEPELVILDEPFEGLDPRGMDDLRDIIRKHAKGHGTTFLISTHLLNEVEDVCDRVIVVERGRLLAQGALAELLHEDEARVEVAAAPRTEAIAAIEALDFARVVDADGDDAELHVFVEKGAEARLNAALVEGGIAVSALVPRPRRLATLFRELTGGRSADRDPEEDAPAPPSPEAIVAPVTSPATSAADGGAS